MGYEIFSFKGNRFFRRSGCRLVSIVAITGLFVVLLFLCAKPLSALEKTTSYIVLFQNDVPPASCILFSEDESRMLVFHTKKGDRLRSPVRVRKNTRRQIQSLREVRQATGLNRKQKRRLRISRLRRQLAIRCIRENQPDESDDSPPQYDFEYTSSISQHGITWTFDKEYRYGRFVNGDYWVQGPVKILSVSPSSTNGRNGSMINPNGAVGNGVSYAKQAFDSRAGGYDDDMLISFPAVIEPGSSLVSAISNPEQGQGNCNGGAGNIDVYGACVNGTWSFLRTATVLTVLQSAAPLDAFRPPYAGIEKPVYRLAQVNMSVLPSLPLVPNTPAVAPFLRYLERPWMALASQHNEAEINPVDNSPWYYREAFSILSEASLLLALDISLEEKESLMIRLIQLGIDQQAIAKTVVLKGFNYDAAGRSLGKSAVALAGYLLNEPSINELQYSYRQVLSTYYADDSRIPVTYPTQSHPARNQAGWTGATVFHYRFGPAGGPYGHLHPQYWQIYPYSSQWTSGACWQELYRYGYTSAMHVGEALAGHLIPGLKEAWKWPAFFDYTDEWMTETGVDYSIIDQYCGAGLVPHGNARSPYSVFVGEMWNAYRW